MIYIVEIYHSGRKPSKLTSQQVYNLIYMLRNYVCVCYQLTG